MFKHWRTSLAGILLAAAQTIETGLTADDSLLSHLIIAGLTAVLGVLARDKSK